MESLRIAGSASSALTHFAMYGLAMVAEYEGAKHVRLSWSNERVPRAVLDIDLDRLQLAEGLRSFAERNSGEESWAIRTLKYGEGEFSPFSPRFKAIDARKYPEDWAKHQAFRSSYLDELLESHQLLELRFIHALGEASYWHSENRQPRPDHGASRLEMKTRNKGEEFIKNRFALMLKELSTWNQEEILAGLTGSQVNDSLASKKEDSRTATGFTPPGPTDVALAFSALLGISSFPLAYHTHRKSVTPGTFPSQASHPSLLVLPLPTTPVTPARLRSMVVSQELALLGLQELKEEQEQQSTDSEVLAAGAWMRARGVPAIAVFPIKKAGTDSAPERQIQAGIVRTVG